MRKWGGGLLGQEVESAKCLKATICSLESSSLKLFVPFQKQDTGEDKPDLLAHLGVAEDYINSVVSHT